MGGHPSRPLGRDLVTDRYFEATDPRPDDRPYYEHPNCETCDTPLMLRDIYEGNEAGGINYDDWICPNHPYILVLDWPPEDRAELFALGEKLTQVADNDVVTLADDRDLGGFKIEALPEVMAQMQ